MKKNNIIRQNLLIGYFILLIILPIFLIILPADYFDKGQSICLSMLLFNKHCPGCGMTRGVQHLIHMDLEVAYKYNKICFIVLPLLIGLWAKEILKTFRKLSALKTNKRSENKS